jgi:hypothetical protein
MHFLKDFLTRVLAHLSPSGDKLQAKELQCCGGCIMNPHIHIAPWFNASGPLVEELESANISVGLLYNPYPKMFLPFDLNEYIHGIAKESEGRIYALASLNMTHDDWSDHREEELSRLTTFL